jgi:dihydrofolate reductase
MIASIWAQTKSRIIGRDSKIPWRYSGDFKRFKRTTLGGVVLMGRVTYESIGRALPGRVNIVVTSQRIAVEATASGDGQATSMMTARSLVDAFDKASRVAPDKDVWVIGGARMYAEAMAYVDFLDISVVPDVVDDATGVVKAPEIDSNLWRLAAECVHPDEPTLSIQRWLKKNDARVFRPFP